MSKRVLDKATENEEKSTWENIKEKVTGKWFSVILFYLGNKNKNNSSIHFKLW